MNIITKIEVGKRNKERVNIYIDEEFAFSLSAEIVYKENLAPKQTVDVEKLIKLAKEDEFMKCKNSALRIVERSYKTEKEVQFTRNSNYVTSSPVIELLFYFETILLQPFLSVHIRSDSYTIL